MRKAIRGSAVLAAAQRQSNETERQQCRHCRLGSLWYGRLEWERDPEKRRWTAAFAVHEIKCKRTARSRKQKTPPTRAGSVPLVWSSLSFLLCRHFCLRRRAKPTPA